MQHVVDGMRRFSTYFAILINLTYLSDLWNPHMKICFMYVFQNVMYPWSIYKSGCSKLSDCGAQGKNIMSAKTLWEGVKKFTAYCNIFFLGTPPILGPHQTAGRNRLEHYDILNLLVVSLLRRNCSVKYWLLRNPNAYSASFCIEFQEYL